MVRISARVTDELHTLETSILAGVWEEIGDGEAGGREAEEQELTACQERSQKSRRRMERRDRFKKYLGGGPIYWT